MLPDPSPTPSAAERPAWEALPVLVVPTRVRILGSAIGFAVGLGIVVATLAVELVAGWAPMPLPPTLALPVVLTGAISGWLMADAGWTTRPGGRTGIVVRMALLAVIVGDAVVVLTVVGGPGGGGNGGLVLMLIGLVLFGWIAVPFTGAASLMWIAAMSFARRRLLEDRVARP